jgi:hypothetical protein
MQDVEGTGAAVITSRLGDVQGLKLVLPSDILGLNRAPCYNESGKPEYLEEWISSNHNEYNI